MSRIKLIIKLTGFIKSLVPVLFVTVIAGFLGFVCAIAIPVLCGYGLLAALEACNLPITTLFTLLAVCCVMRGVFRYLEHYSGHYVAFRLLALFRDRVFAAMRRLAPAKMETQNSGDLVSLITSDIELLEVFYAHTIAPVIIAVLISAGMIMFIGTFNIWCGALATVAYLTVGAIVPLASSRGTIHLGKDYRSAFSSVTTHFLDCVRGVSEILQFGQGEKKLLEISDKSADLNKRVNAVRRHENQTASIADALVLGFSASMLTLCVFLYQSGLVSISGVIIPIAAMLGSFGAVLAVANLAGGLHGTFAAAQRVFALLEEKPETEDILGEVKKMSGDVTLSNVNFGYGEGLVFNGFNLRVSKGEMIGIMGASGCGKSTLLRLIMRFWDVHSGQIRIGNTSLRDFPTKELRNATSFLSQDTYIFNTSILENIRIGKPKASEEEVVKAAKMAAIHDFIVGLREGYHTHAGELGERFSTGERQRIGLARMFLHDAPLMLLDEPTSNIDTLNERIILRSISQAKKDKTVIIVSHRKSTLSVSDKIYQIEGKEQYENI